MSYTFGWCKIFIKHFHKFFVDFKSQSLKGSYYVRLTDTVVAVYVYFHINKLIETNI